MTEWEQHQAMVQSALDRYGRLDVDVNEILVRPARQST